MLGIFADVFGRATYLNQTRDDQRGDWRAPTHWQDSTGETRRHKGWRGDYDD